MNEPTERDVNKLIVRQYEVVCKELAERLGTAIARKDWKVVINTRVLLEQAAGHELFKDETNAAPIRRKH